MNIEVLYFEGCPNHLPAIEMVRETLKSLGRQDEIHQVEVHTQADAEAVAFVGSPSIRINGADIEPWARTAKALISGGNDSIGASGSTALFAGGLAAILASTCCLGPLILISLGFSGAWIGSLTVLEPYRPFFIVAAVLGLFFAGRQIFRPAHLCKPGEVCALPRARRIYKFLFWSCATLVLVALVYPYVARFFY